MYGLIRRTALEHTSIMPDYLGAEKVILVELSLLGRYHLLREPLFYRRFHIYQSGTKNPSKASTHTVKIAAAYIRAIAAARLTPAQRTRCVGIIVRRVAARALHGANR
jgi:hypothetical protein